MSFFYGPLSQSDAEILPESSNDDISREKPDRQNWIMMLRCSPVHWWCYASNILLLIISSTILLVSIFVNQTNTERCIEKQSVYCKASPPTGTQIKGEKNRRHDWLMDFISLSAPLLEVLSDDYQLWKFNGTFRKSSPYKGPPSPSVDAAWDNLEHGSEFWYRCVFQFLHLLRGIESDRMLVHPSSWRLSHQPRSPFEDQRLDRLGPIPA